MTGSEDFRRGACEWMYVGRIPAPRMTTGAPLAYFSSRKRAKRERGLLQVYILDEVGLEILEEERERRLPAGGDFSSPPRFVIKVKTKCFSAFRSLFFV